MPNAPLTTDRLEPTSVAGVLVAGIGGASLGTEVIKSLRLAGGYRLFGCDISPLAFGHYGGLLDKSMIVRKGTYIDDILNLCSSQGLKVVIPGGDEPARLIAAAHSRFAERGIAVAANSSAVVAELADKALCFLRLAKLGFPIPRTFDVEGGIPSDLPMPCILKPAIDSGGSAFVFFARSVDEAALYAEYMRRNGLRPIAQEYITHENGEFTVGVLSKRDGSVVGGVAMKRAFPAKLSVAARGAGFLISSGYSQGHIGPYEAVCATAIAIAKAVDSRGPINIQGRVDADGRFLPFEINPRFSASTYLRAVAGFNEVDYFVRHLLGQPLPTLAASSGWHLRSLTEAFIPDGGLIT